MATIDLLIIFEIYFVKHFNIIYLDSFESK